MFADQALRCECGYEVRAFDEAARVHEVRRHASETHGIDLSADVALDVVRRGQRSLETSICNANDPTPRSETQRASALSQTTRDGRRRAIPSGEE